MITYNDTSKIQNVGKSFSSKENIKLLVQYRLF